MATRDKVIERPSGEKGVVYRGTDSLFTAPYSLVVTQEIHIEGTDEIEGFTDTSGKIKVAENTVMALLGQDLILQLEDGRRLPFMFRSEDGSIRARSGFEQPED